MQMEKALSKRFNRSRKYLKATLQNHAGAQFNLGTVIIMEKALRKSDMKPLNVF